LDRPFNHLFYARGVGWEQHRDDAEFIFQHPAATTIVLTEPLATIISGAFEPLASTAAPIAAAREMPRTTRQAGGIGSLRAVFIFMVCLSYLRRASSSFERLPLRFPTQRRGGSQKTGHGLHYSNAVVGSKRLLQFFLLLLKPYSDVCQLTGYSRFGYSYSDAIKNIL
jgi:hypothetical protein